MNWVLVSKVSLLNPAASLKTSSKVCDNFETSWKEGITRNKYVCHMYKLEAQVRGYMVRIRGKL